MDAHRLRFDFTHFAPMTKEELDKVEAIVNEKIEENLPVLTKVMPIEEAKKTGAMALFGEKYGDDVRVVSMGEFSKDCAEVPMFQIQERSVSLRLFPSRVLRQASDVLRR